MKSVKLEECPHCGVVGYHSCSVAAFRLEIANLENRIEAYIEQVGDLLLWQEAARHRLGRILQMTKMAQSKLRATQINWQEQCLFNCDDVLTGIIGELDAPVKKDKTE